MRAAAPFFLAAALAGCGPTGAPERDAAANEVIETVDVPQTVERLAPGTTPMRARIAVLGLLNKRNGIARDLRLRPGQSVRIGDIVVRLRACETSAPWEIQSLTGAFVQLDVREADGRARRVFSGWLYRESPSLNTVEHPVWDVWPKSCAMTHPGGEEAEEAAPSNASSARQLAGEETALSNRAR